MDETIKNFNKQFLYEPEIKNQEKLTNKSSFIVVGMGGSGHAAELVKTQRPELDITIRRNYGLPEISIEELKNKLIILSSYSGNTEEVIDAFEEAKEKKLEMAVIAVGGKLLALAKENNVPYIELPNTGIEPRMAIGFSIKAFLKFIREESELKNITTLATTLKPVEYEEKGKMLAEKMRNYVPIIYVSNCNSLLAYIWKITLNETGKIPAFCNVFPELNHNEINGFDVKDSIKELCDKFYFIFLQDEKDSPKILKRMKITEKLYQDRNLQTQILELKGENIWHKIFSSIVLANWVSYYSALQYELKPEGAPIVEELKKLILE